MQEAVLAIIAKMLYTDDMILASKTPCKNSYQQFGYFFQEQRDNIRDKCNHELAGNPGTWPRALFISVGNEPGALFARASGECRMGQIPNSLPRCKLDAAACSEVFDLPARQILRKKGEKEKMSQLRNLPTEAAQAFAELITVRNNQVISMALAKESGIKMTLLAFAEGEDVSEEQYFGDTLYYVLDGTAVICREEKESAVKTGEVLMVPAGVVHAVRGKGAFKLLQITLEG